MLKTSLNCKVLGKHENAEELFEDFRELNHAVVLMNIKLPDMFDIEATTQLKRKYPRAQDHLSFGFRR